METVNIMIVGVGGQGSLLASKMLGHLLVQQGYDVKVSEVHGMSQRGGSVVTYVRFGEKVYSPIIDKGEADYIVSFELLEAARWIEYLKPTGRDCLALAEQAGSTKAVNMVLMGRLSKYFPDIPQEAWQASLEANVPAKVLELNKVAFALGQQG